MRIDRLIKNLNWKSYVMELAIVILGISIAYQLNIVYEKSVNQKLEMTAIKNLQKEIEINIAEFISLQEYRTRITKDSRSLLNLLKGPKGISIDSANKYIFRLVQTSTPDLQQEAANFYLNSNYSSSNIELKNELLTLKTYFAELLSLSEGYTGRKESGFKKLLWSSADFPERKVTNLKMINSLEFKNTIWDQTSDEYELNRLFDQAFEELRKIQTYTHQLIKNWHEPPQARKGSTRSIIIF